MIEVRTEAGRSIAVISNDTEVLALPGDVLNFGGDEFVFMYARMFYKTNDNSEMDVSRIEWRVTPRYG